MRSKFLLLMGTAAAGAVALLAGSQTWISFMLDGDHTLETVTGHDVNPALSPIAIAVIAAALALTIAGKIFRRVLGVLVALLGAGLVALSWTVLAAPLSAVSGKITELTGITGGASGTMVVWSQIAWWVYACLIVGCVTVLLGVAVVVTGSRWVAGGRKYSSGATSRTDADGDRDRISDWDALSEGDDPSENFR